MAKKAETIESMTTFPKEALDAFMEAATTSGKGMEKLQAEFMAYAKSSGEAFSAATKAIFGAGSFEAAMEAQQAYVKSAFETHMTEMGKLTQLFSESVKASLEPFAAQARMFAGAFALKAA
ncbi:MAG: phasin family protein [Micropepsaceae bacterium]